MYCKFCGIQIDDNSVFCRFCGKNQNSTGENTNTETARDINVTLKVGTPKFKGIKPKKKKKAPDKYDRNYKPKTGATVFGVLLFFASLFTLIYFEFAASIEPNFFAFYAIGIFIIRIIVVVSVSNIAKNQNRDSFNWGFFALLFPSIALIIIGQLRKLKDNKDASTQRTTVSSSSKEYVDQRSDSLEVKPGFIKVRDLQSEKVDIYSKSQWNLIRSNHPDRFYKIIVDKTKETL